MSRTHQLCTKAQCRGTDALVTVLFGRMTVVGADMTRTAKLSMSAAAVAALAVASFGGPSFGHGDVQPQPVDTTGLESLGEEWSKENPYRGNEKAVEIGASGYNQNCARCHGLQAISGGIAPDLRYLEINAEGDEWYLERVRKGATLDGVTKMPAFEGILSQEALWAIRTYIESRHED
jgi:cytochrome c-550 PedF